MEQLQIKSEKERNQLINEVASVQKHRDDLLLQFEAEKQEELHAVAKEKVLLVEQFNKKTEEIEELSAEIEKLRRDSSSRAAKDKVCFWWNRMFEDHAFFLSIYVHQKKVCMV